MLALSSSSTLSLMAVLPLPFPMPTTQQVHLKPALPPWWPLFQTDLTSRSPPELPDPPDPPEPQVSPSKHDLSINLWKVSGASQPRSTHLKLDSGDPASLLPPPAAPSQPPLQGSVTKWSLPPLIALTVQSVTPTKCRAIRSTTDVSSSCCGSGFCLSERRASCLPPSTRAVWYREMCFQFILMDLMSLVELPVYISILNLMKTCSTGQRISSGLSTNFWTCNIGVRSISLITASVSSSNTVSSISLLQPPTNMCLTIHNQVIESRLQLLPRVHIALFQILIVCSWPRSFVLCGTSTGQSSMFFSVKSNHLGFCKSPFVPQHLSRKAEDISSIICITVTAWSKEKKTVGSGCIFSGTVMAAPSQGPAIQVFVNPSLNAEALAMRSTLCKALTFDFANFKVLSNNSTLIRAIIGESQSKEIIGILVVFRVISSGFATIWLFHLCRSEIFCIRCLSFSALQALLMCNGLLELDHLWILSIS